MITFRWSAIFGAHQTVTVTPPPPTSWIGTPPTVDVSVPQIQLRSCTQCGAYVADDSFILHEGWHEKMQTLAKSVGLNFANYL